MAMSAAIPRAMKLGITLNMVIPIWTVSGQVWTSLLCLGAGIESGLFYFYCVVVPINDLPVSDEEYPDTVPGLYGKI